MKRVQLVSAAALPALASMTLTATAAHAADSASKPGEPRIGTKTVSAVPLTSGKHCNRDVCISVVGYGQWVSKIHEWITHSYTYGDKFRIFFDSLSSNSPYYFQRYLWYSHNEEGTPWKGTREYTWNTNCRTWTPLGIASASGYNTYGSPHVGVHGFSLKTPICHYIKPVSSLPAWY